MIGSDSKCCLCVLEFSLSSSLDINSLIVKLNYAKPVPQTPNIIEILHIELETLAT